MVQNATVIAVSGGICDIEVSRKAMCDGCHKTKCGSGCPMSGLLSAGEKMTAKAVNKAGAAVGDRVEIETSDREVLGLAAAVFLLPVILGGAFYAVAEKLGVQYPANIISAVVGFVIPFPFLRIAEKRRDSQEPKLTVTRILNVDTETPDED